MTRTLWLLAGLILITNVGCQTMPEFSTLWEEKAPSGKPVELAAIWQEGIDVQLDPNQGGNQVPGFAGRIFFMKPQSSGPHSETIVVNGTLVVSLYEDKPYQGPPQALETWTILPEHLPMLIKKDMTGWGYSLWLPWNTFNPNLRSVRLIVHYTGNDGAVLKGVPMQISVQAKRNSMPKPELTINQASKKTWQ